MRHRSRSHRRGTAPPDLAADPVDSLDKRWPADVARDAAVIPIVVLAQHAGMRLDKYLTIEMPRLSRSRAARIAAQYAYAPDGTRLTPAKIVRAGERLVLYRPTDDEPEVSRDVGILYEDAAIVAVDKPAGLPVHPTARFHRNTLTSILALRYPRAHIALCHRLDKDTSGVLLAARNADAERALKRAFAARGLQKTYLAIVRGIVAQDEMHIDAPLALAGGEVSVLMAVRAESAGGQPATTRVRVRERLEDCTLVEASPETGRQHQIRVHLAHAGHPILGDKLYAFGPEPFLASLRGEPDVWRERLVLERHALHAHQIAFEHPESGQWMTVESPLAPDLATFLVARRRRAMGGGA